MTKQNEARPIFRFFAGFIALISWLVFILFGMGLILGDPLEQNAFLTCIGRVFVLCRFLTSPLAATCLNFS